MGACVDEGFFELKGCIAYGFASPDFAWGLVSRPVHLRVARAPLGFVVRLYSGREVPRDCWHIQSQVGRSRQNMRDVPGPGSFLKLGVPYIGVLTIRVLLFRVLY